MSKVENNQRLLQTNFFLNIVMWNVENNLFLL